MAQETKDLKTAILEDHEDVKRIFADLESGSGDRAATWEALVRALAVHETAEEEILYPAVRSAGGDAVEAAVKARLAEEDEAKKVLAGMEKTGPEASSFLGDVAKLKAAVLAHAESEEQEILPHLDTVDPKKLQTLATAFRAAKALAPTHAHKGAPESALANMAVGPFIAIVDRVRDVIHDALKKAS